MYVVCSILELPSDIKPGESATASSNESSFVTPYKYTPGKMDSLKEVSQELLCLTLLLCVYSFVIVVVVVGDFNFCCCHFY